MPQVGDAQLTERAIVVLQRDLAIQNAWRLIDAGNALELNPTPGRYRGSDDFFDSFFDRIRSVMNRIPIWFSSLRLA